MLAGRNRHGEPHDSLVGLYNIGAIDARGENIYMLLLHLTFGFVGPHMPG